MSTSPSRHDVPWHDVPAGAKQAVPLAVCRRGDGGELSLTLLVARGAKQGSTLLLISAVHGDEYEGPAALWQTFEHIDPARLAGTLVLLPVTNPPAYEAGLRVNPADPKDLARTFPGSPRGTVTEQIAHLMRHAVIPHADLMCDFHSAGRYYRIDPWAGYGLVSDAALLERQRQAARAVGYPLIWGTPLYPGRTLSAAFECKVPALYVEAPGEGRAHPDDVTRNVRAARQLLRLLRMIDEPLEDIPAELVVEDNRPDTGYLQIQTVTRHGGYFQPAVRLAEHVAAGQPLGSVLDVAGRTLEDITAPCTGRVVFLRTFPVVAPGDSLGTVMERQ